jgi:predicted GNAT family acetyltransferase
MQLGQRWGLAARYRADVARFSALAVSTDKAFEDFSRLPMLDEAAAFFTSLPLQAPPGWRTIRSRQLEQMVCDQLDSQQRLASLTLGITDVPEMIELTAATDPGPFLEGSINMGRYLGLRSTLDGRLVAMAGERLRLTRFTEISAVCTDPAFRGRGYAAALVVELALGIMDRGDTPFLHVKNENSAKRLYEKLGFRFRKAIHLTVLARH